MVLRVFGGALETAGGSAGAGDAATAAGPGTRHLARLREARERARRAPEIEFLRPALDSLVRAERIQRGSGRGLVLTAYHLVERGEGRLYREAVERAGPAAGALRFRVSGPWPPYAFSGEVRW